MRVLDDDFAVILMDVQMPGMDGFETAALIRERDRSKHTPIIFLTAFQSTERQVFQGYALGAVDYLSKPIVPAVLRSKVAVFVELFQKTEQVKRQAAELHETQRREHERELARAEAALGAGAAPRGSRPREAGRRGAGTAGGGAGPDRRRARPGGGATPQACGPAGDRGRTRAAGPGGRSTSPPCWTRPSPRPRGTWRWSSASVMELDPDGRVLVLLPAWAGERVPISHARAGRRDRLAGRLHPAVRRAGGRRGPAHRVAVRGRACCASTAIISGMSVVIYGRDRPYGTLGVFSDPPPDLHAGRRPLPPGRRQRAGRRHPAQAGRGGTRGDPRRAGGPARGHDPAPRPGARLSNSLELAEVLEEVLAAVTEPPGHRRGRAHAPRPRARRDVHGGQRRLHGRATGRRRGADRRRSGPTTPMTAVISGGIVVEDAASRTRSSPPTCAAARRAGYHAVCTTPLLTAGGEMVGSIATYFPGIPPPVRPRDPPGGAVRPPGRPVHRQRAALPRDPRGRPPQGRVPGDAGARAAQPAGARS